MLQYHKNKIRFPALTLVSAVLFTALCTAFCVPVSAAPAVSAKSAVLMEADSGRVIWEQNGSARMPMASTTKIMTALVAIERFPLDGIITVAPAAVGVEGSSVYLTAGEQLTLEQLLYALLLESANDAAAAIAIGVAGSVDAFAALMNEKAASLGLSDTHFTNPHGLDHQAHYTTARDLAALAAHAMQDARFAAIVGTYKKIIPRGDGVRLLLNHNKLLKNHPDVIGVKTGFTKKSGRCLVSAARRDGVTLIAVTLSAPDDWNDHAAMLEYGFAKYRSQILAEAGTLLFEIPVMGGEAETVVAVNTENLRCTLPAEGGEITSVCEVKRFVCAPVRAGDVLGQVIFYRDGARIGALPVTAASDVPAIREKAGVWERFFDFMKHKE